MMTSARSAGALRWESYFLARGAGFQALWRELYRATERRVLLICGAGFDPRATNAAHDIVATGVPITACTIVEFDEGPNSPSQRYAQAAEANRTRLEGLIAGGSTSVVRVDMRRPEGRAVGGRQVAAAFTDPGRFRGFSDTVVDITALPRCLYFPLIAALLELWSEPDGEPLGNLHVVVCENAGVDRRILEEGGDKAEWVHGFASGLPRVAEAEVPRIWAPVLGEGQAARLKKIAEFANPQEICPVLPFPASNPRRADDLIGEYRELLFDTWRVEPRDVIYAAEQNPFDVYRQLCRLDERYASALRPLGGAKTIVSAHSSKLLSLGVLLAAFERHLAVPQVQPTGYVVQDGFQPDDSTGELFDAWLQGEPHGRA